MPVFRDLCDLLHRRKRAHAERPRGAAGVLLISSGGLGDTILFSVMAPVFAKLRTRDEPFDIIVQKGAEAVQFLYPEGVNLIGVDYRRFIRDPCYRYRMSDRLFDVNYRLAVSTDHLRLPTVDDVLIAATAAERSYALAPRPWPKHDAALAANRRLYTDWVTPGPEMAHRMVRWWELADGLLDGDTSLPTVRFADATLPQAERRARPYLVLHPFSSEAARQHGVDIWTRLIEVFSAGREIVLSVGPGDLDRFPEFQPMASRAEVAVDTRGLRDKCGLLRGADLVVSVDTSVMHLAVGAGAPTLCLASAAHVVDSIPYDPRIAPDNVSFLYHDMDCRGCLGACIHPLQDQRFPCVQGLDAETVVAAVATRLQP